MLVVPIRGQRITQRVGILIHLISLLGLFLAQVNGFFLALALLAVAFSAIKFHRSVTKTLPLTQLQCHEQTCHLQYHQNWIAVKTDTVLCNRFFIVLDLFSVELDGPAAGSCWRLWFFPNSLTQTTQRKLRKFLRKK